MTPQEKQDLLLAICGYFPYKLRCRCINGLGGGKTDEGVLKFFGNCYGVISNYYENIPIHSGFVDNVFYPLENIKPYLRSLSSMTEKESEEFNSISPFPIGSAFNRAEMKLKIYDYIVADTAGDTKNVKFSKLMSIFNWLNSHYFDYHNLINRGLAIEAPKNMYKI